jgi:membrane protease YdiL (CAAX protease family)
VSNSQRILLAIWLPLAGLLAAASVGVLLLAVGVRSEAALSTVALVIGSLALVAGAAFTPRGLDQGLYSTLRKIFAGVAGVAAAAVVGRGLTFLGIDGEALSHNPSPSALMQEGTMLVAFYGTMFVVPFVALGRPSRTATRPPNDEMQLTAPAQAMERRS